MLSESTVAVSCYSPGRIEIWDWQSGMRLHALDDFGGYALANAAYPGGLLITGSQDGRIRIGDPANWKQSRVLAHGATTDGGFLEIFGVVVAQDGSFVAADRTGHIRVWDGESLVASIPGCFQDGAYGVPLAIVGNRIVFAAQSMGVVGVIDGC